MGLSVQLRLATEALGGQSLIIHEHERGDERAGCPRWLSTLAVHAGSRSDAFCGKTESLSETCPRARQAFPLPLAPQTRLFLPSRRPRLMMGAASQPRSTPLHQLAEGQASQPWRSGLGQDPPRSPAMVVFEPGTTIHNAGSKVSVSSFALSHLKEERSRMQHNSPWHLSNDMKGQKPMIFADMCACAKAAAIQYHLCLVVSRLKNAQDGVGLRICGDHNMYMYI